MASGYLDTKYINLISSRLEMFKWKSGSLCNFRCPFCGDSKKDKTKTRGYFYEKDGGYVFHCHNCHLTLPLGNVIKTLDPRIYSDYILEKYRKEGGNKPTERIINSISKPKVKAEIKLPTCANQGSSKARSYLQKRKIPAERFEELFYTPTYKNFIDTLLPGNDKDRLPNDERIIIPCYHSDGVLIGVTGRALDPLAKTRYAITKVNDDYNMLYGLNKFNKNKEAFVTEGPFDSMFLPNALAACGSNIKDICVHVNPDVTTFILDNEPRNKDIISQMRKVVGRKLNIFIWPKNIFSKDINDWFLSGTSISEIVDTINKNTYRGLMAEHQINSWKKI